MGYEPRIVVRIDRDAEIEWRCPRRQCRGRVPHSRLIHWFGWARR